MYALGLDWVSTKKGWAYCRLSLEKKRINIELGTLKIGEEAGVLIQNASHVAIDAPIGLPETKQDGTDWRPCDLAARAWIGPDLQRSVFRVPVLQELVVWRNNTITGDKQKQGHSMGLLPAIGSASHIFDHHEHVVESHPELVFASLLGKPLPRIASKVNLFGQSLRLAILKKAAGVVFTLSDYSRMRPSLSMISSDNFIDAIAMALVAHSWSVNNAVYALTKADQPPKLAATNRADRVRLMALPQPFLNPSGQRPTTDDLLDTLSAWMRD